MTEADTTCAMTPGCKRPQTVGLSCAGHYARLGQMLADVEMETALLSPMPSMAVKTGRTGGLASHRSPARLDAIVALDGRRGLVNLTDSVADPIAYDDTASILDVLGSWARVVREERNFATRGTATIATERDALARHLEHIVAQPWLDEFYNDISALLSQLRSCNGTQPDKPVGRCYLVDEDEQCGGPIWIDTAAGHAYCGKCRSTWDGQQLTLLHLAIEQDRAEAKRPRTSDGRPMLTAHELVRDGHVSSVSNVRVLAHRRGIAAVEGHYDPQEFGKVTA